MDSLFMLHHICNIYKPGIIKNHNLLPLKIESMIEEYENRKRKQVSLMRSLLDYGIGLMIVVAGVFLFFRANMNLDFNERYPPNKWDKILGVIFLLYGSWRIYRGYKKNYFK